DQLLPVHRLFSKTPFSRARQPIELRSTVVLRDSPLGSEQPPVLQTMQRGVQRALLDLQRATGNLFNPQQHAIAVQLPERNGLQDQDIQRSRQQLGGSNHGVLLACLGG